MKVIRFASSRCIRWVLALLLVSVSMVSISCEAVALGTIGTALGIFGSAVSTGGAIFSQGKLDSAEMSTMENWVAAIDAAANELNLKVLPPATTQPSTRPTSDVVVIILADDKNSTIKITVERRTQTMLRSRISVGYFGSEPTARLLLTRIRKHAGVPPADGGTGAEKS